MLRVIMEFHHAEYHYAVLSYVEWHCAECYQA
jgi:hypothetical protein